MSDDLIRAQRYVDHAAGVESEEVRIGLLLDAVDALIDEVHSLRTELGK